MPPAKSIPGRRPGRTVMAAEEASGGALGDLVTLTTRHLRKGDKLLMGMAICARLDLPISVKRGTKPPPLSRRGIDQCGNSA
jgi:hypothetical protein